MTTLSTHRFILPIYFRTPLHVWHAAPQTCSAGHPFVGFAGGAAGLAGAFAWGLGGGWGAQLDNTSLISRIYTPMYFSPEQTHQGMEVRCTAPAGFVVGLRGAASYPHTQE